MGLGAKPRKGLSLPAPNSEHTFQQLLQGSLQGRILSNLRGTLGGSAIAHHLDPRNFQTTAIISKLRFTPLISRLLYRTILKKEKKKIINPLLEKKRKILLEREDTSKTTRHAIYKPNVYKPTSGFRSSSRSAKKFSRRSSSSIEFFRRISLFLFLIERGFFRRNKKKKKKNECTRATGNAGAGDESSALPRRMPSAGSWNATRRPDPLTAGQKLLLPLALPLGPLLHSQLYSALA